MLKVAEIERTQIEWRLAAQDRFRSLAVLNGNERNRRLRTQTDVTGPAVRCQPEFDFRAGGRIPPMSGQNETLFKLSQTSTSKAGVIALHDFTAMRFEPLRHSRALPNRLDLPPDVGRVWPSATLDAAARRNLYDRAAAIPSGTAHVPVKSLNTE
jgi:hypothetical protein